MQKSSVQRLVDSRASSWPQVDISFGGTQKILQYFLLITQFDSDVNDIGSIGIARVEERQECPEQLQNRRLSLRPCNANVLLWPIEEKNVPDHITDC